MAAFAAYPQESMFQPPAFEVILKLLVYIRRQISFLGFEVLLERRIVLVNDLIKESLLRTVAHIEPRALAQTGFPASG